ncbi:hypothetical protein F503_02600 [Ophiostoma piceae UAMH 11346]|uniref:Stc1 domain-containing protein n=1 Tax=Ophiostoma piceae (strain UAMH 11346) TaxID=1262450 RepID=S3C151_OPHP1|nr:hypothetical protein F503_02600 [Ophiostoma piceae UAMH 11346]
MAARDPGPVPGYMRSPAERDTPSMIRCFTNGEWKERSEFSTRQLDKFSRSGASAGNSQISCREHTTQVRRELKCEGPCGDWYPLEVFSRSTRSHSKTWCLHCTEWQLSVEPGYAPFNPPTALDMEEDAAGEDRLLEATGTDRVSQAMADRIVDWIQQNPSEDGDSEALATATMVGSVTRDSINPPTSLLDSPNTGLDLLPVALSVANASRTVNGAHSGPSYASIAAAAADSEMLPGLLGQPTEPGAMTPRGDAVVDAQQPRHPPTAGSDSSDDTAQGPSQNFPVAAPTPDTAWVEDEFSALTISQAGSSIHLAGWARPNQRRTDLMTPRYVANSRGTENQPLSTQRVTYAEDDEYDSGDEC